MVRSSLTPVLGARRPPERKRARTAGPRRQRAPTPPERCDGPRQHGVEHRRGQSPGERVLLADVVAAEQRQPAARPVVHDRHLAAVGEPRPRPADRPASRRQRVERRAPGERTEGDHHAGRHQLELTDEVRRARVTLRRRRAVGRRCAMHRRGHPHAAEHQPVVDGGRRRLRRQAGAMQRRHEHVAGAVAGEHPPGAVGAVRRRRQPDDHDRRIDRAEPGHRPPPVDLGGERRPAGRRHLLPPGDQARARPAGDDEPIDVVHARGVRRPSRRKPALGAARRHGSMVAAEPIFFQL